MRVVPFTLSCECGGKLVRFKTETAFSLTEKEDIIFEGICNKCDATVTVKASLSRLWLDCPRELAVH